MPCYEGRGTGNYGDGYNAGLKRCEERYATLIDRERALEIQCAQWQQDRLERDEMGNILCEMGKAFEEHGAGIFIPSQTFLDWWQRHKKRDEEKNK